MGILIQQKLLPDKLKNKWNGVTIIRIQTRNSIFICSLFSILFNGAGKCLIKKGAVFAGCVILSRFPFYNSG